MSISMSVPKTKPNENIEPFILENWGIPEVKENGKKNVDEYFYIYQCPEMATPYNKPPFIIPENYSLVK